MNDSSAQRRHRRRHGSNARWYCPNCGQTYFGDLLPDMCDFCGDLTTWQPLDDTPPDDDTPVQLPLFDGND